MSDVAFTTSRLSKPNNVINLNTMPHYPVDYVLRYATQYNGHDKVWRLHGRPQTIQLLKEIE